MPNTKAMITEANLQDFGYWLVVSASLVFPSLFSFSLRLVLSANIVALASGFMVSFGENMSKYLMRKRI